MNMHRIHLLIGTIGGILAVVVLVAVSLSAANQPHVPHYNEVHIHADFAVYLDNERIDFSESVYHSDERAVRHPFLHLHDGDGDVVHIHAKQQTLADFFESLGIHIDEHCLVRGDRSYCRTNNLQMFVNGKEWIQPFNTYTPRDLDRILLTNTTNPETLEIEKNQVTDRACIQSESCPERGMAVEGCSTSGDCTVPPAVKPISHNHAVHKN